MITRKKMDEKRDKGINLLMDVVTELEREFGPFPKAKSRARPKQPANRLMDQADSDEQDDGIHVKKSNKRRMAEAGLPTYVKSINQEGNQLTARVMRKTILSNGHTFSSAQSVRIARVIVGGRAVDYIGRDQLSVVCSYQNVTFFWLRHLTHKGFRLTSCLFYFCRVKKLVIERKIRARSRPRKALLRSDAGPILLSFSKQIRVSDSSAGNTTDIGRCLSGCLPLLKIYLLIET
jgi:hypothetical protein